jgi:hypothetical protein
MDPADMREVFKRLGEREYKFLDERMQEMPLVEHLASEPLFLKREKKNAS